MRRAAPIMVSLHLLWPLTGLAQTASAPPRAVQETPPPGTCPADPEEAKRLGCMSGGMMERADEMKETARAMAGQGMATGFSVMTRMLEEMQKAAAPHESVPAGQPQPKAPAPPAQQ